MSRRTRPAERSSGGSIPSGRPGQARWMMQCIRSRWPRQWAAHGPGSGASAAQSWAEVRLGVGEPLLEQLCDRTPPRSALLTRLDDQRGEGPRLVPQSVLATASPSTPTLPPTYCRKCGWPSAPPAHGSRCQHTLFGHHRVHLGLEPRAQDDELGPIADQLPQLPGRRRGDPRPSAASPGAACQPGQRRRVRRSSPAAAPS
jgi:hypothetical protein